MADNLTFFESINPIRVLSGGEPTGETLATPESPLAATINKTVGQLEEAARMIALRRSLVIGVIVLVLSAILKAINKQYWAGVMATVGVVTIVLAIAQYVV